MDCVRNDTSPEAVFKTLAWAQKYLSGSRISPLRWTTSIASEPRSCLETAAGLAVTCNASVTLRGATLSEKQCCIAQLWHRL